jgi:hypothetical protein
MMFGPLLIMLFQGDAIDPSVLARRDRRASRS